MKKYYWLDFTTAVLAFVLVILSVIANNWLGFVLWLFVMLVDTYLFLDGVAQWWKASEKVKKKFVFTCKHCGHKHTPSFWRWFFVPHIFSRRYLKCPKCKKLSMMRRK